MPLGPVYQARVLFVQVNDEALKILNDAWRRDLALTELETKVRLGGYTTLFSRAMPINPLDPKIKSMFGELELPKELASVEADPPFLTKVFRLPNSYAVLEILAVRPAPDPAELARAGQKAFERATGQAAFHGWVTKLKRQASIVINPNYPDLGNSVEEASLKESALGAKLSSTATFNIASDSFWRESLP
jgi:hypothetical protein